jgi:predicted phage terminase large subunit-like protein
MAARELIRRQDATADLISFTEYTYPKYQTAPLHRIIATQLERVERGEVDRLALLVPPRHGKSELASRRFPAWYLGRHPAKQFISASATESLASDFGRDVRNILLSIEYRALFDTRLAEDSQARGRWHTDQGGVYLAVGVGSQIMGRGGDVVLIDDPFATMADAQSQLERKNVWDWYQGTIYNRLQPKGAVIVINHRMHEEDLVGQLLAQQAAGGDRWEVVELPAISEAGEALWPQAYPLEALERIRLNSSARHFSALYQQRPAPDEGTFWLADWFRPYVRAPDRATLRVYGASDYAVTEDGGDYTVHIVVGVDPAGQLWLLDLWRAQTTPDKWIEAYCDMVRAWKPIGWAEETGQIRAAVGPLRMRMAIERQAYVALKQFPTRHDKAIRAASMRGRVAQLGLYVPANASWYGEFRNELLNFPAGKHDDQHDALGLVGQLLDVMIKGQVARETEPIRGAREMTMEEVWEHGRARRGGLNGRI